VIDRSNFQFSLIDPPDAVHVTLISKSQKCGFNAPRDFPGALPERAARNSEWSPRTMSQRVAGPLRQHVPGWDTGLSRPSTPGRWHPETAPSGWDPTPVVVVQCLPPEPGNLRSVPRENVSTRSSRRKRSNSPDFLNLRRFSSSTRDRKGWHSLVNQLFWAGHARRRSHLITMLCVAVPDLGYHHYQKPL